VRISGVDKLDIAELKERGWAKWAYPLYFCDICLEISRNMLKFAGENYKQVYT